MPTILPIGYRADTAGHVWTEPVYPYQEEPPVTAVCQWPPPGGERPIEELMDDLWARGWPFPRPRPVDRPEALRPEEV